MVEPDSDWPYSEPSRTFDEGCRKVILVGFKARAMAHYLGHKLACLYDTLYVDHFTGVLLVLDLHSLEQLPARRRCSKAASDCILWAASARE